MTPLSFISAATAPITINALIYGGPGVGKTTAALGAPGPILLLNAEGPNAPRFARKFYQSKTINEVAMEGPETLTDVYHHLLDGKGGEQTLVVDSLGEIHTQLLEKAAGGSKKEIQQYGDAMNHLERFCRLAFKNLPQNVILITHELDGRDTDGEQILLPFTGTSNPVLGRKIMARADVVAYAAATSTEDGTRRVAQFTNGAGRFGKNREGLLGKWGELDPAAWIAAYAEANTPTKVTK